VTYGAQAEAVTNHMAKGRRVAVTGRLEYREWTTADKVRHSILEVVTSQIDFLDAPPTNGSPPTAPTTSPSSPTGEAGTGQLAPLRFPACQSPRKEPAMLTELTLTHPCGGTVQLVAGVVITHCPTCGEWLGSAVLRAEERTPARPHRWRRQLPGVRA
jgi:hypothetical protein